MGNLLDHIDGKDARERDHWVTGIEAIVVVNEDPENQHRIKVVIPSIDENNINDKWVRQMGVHVLGPGYGSFFIPPIGSEVVLFGRLGEKHNLYFMSVYNEDYIVPPDFADSTVAGVRAPGELKHIAELDYQLSAGRIVIEADATVRIKAPGGVFINGQRY